jgi:hypothetical protein
VASLSFSDSPFRFKNINAALKINKTLRNMPLPVIDIAEVLQQQNSAQEQLQKTLAKIERAILNNQSLANG